MRLDFGRLGMIRGGLLIVTLTAAACSAETGANGPERTGTPEVYGGDVDTAHPAVAYLVGSTDNENGTIGTSTCTGTLIAPTVILTAGHCLVVYNRDVKRARFEMDREHAKWIDIVDFRMHPEYDSHASSEGHDIAVALLAEPAPVAPLPYNREALRAELVGQPLRVVGYGDSDDFEPEAGIKRQALISLTSFSDKWLESGDLDHHTLEGDSGGPALMNLRGVETIVGVLSRGEYPRDQPFGSSRVARQFHTRVDADADFIDAFVESVRSEH
ncbi:MAG TPA: trypsin-like serine protease [Polyangiaceae bacterium]|nr:trypsin-like serine protease [Polyangiaceae bacterium]